MDRNNNVMPLLTLSSGLNGCSMNCVTMIFKFTSPKKIIILIDKEVSIIGKFSRHFFFTASSPQHENHVKQLQTNIQACISNTTTL